MKIEVSNGEIIDKLSILSIKLERVKEKDKIPFIRDEYNSLLQATTDILHSDPSSNKDYQELKRINEKLWDVEETLREKEMTSNFDTEFIEAARQVYSLNDYRFAVKLRINSKTDSSLVEHKSHKSCYKK